MKQPQYFHCCADVAKRRKNFNKNGRIGGARETWILNHMKKLQHWRRIWKTLLAASCTCIWKRKIKPYAWSHKRVSRTLKDNENFLCYCEGALIRLHDKNKTRIAVGTTVLFTEEIISIFYSRLDITDKIAKGLSASFEAQKSQLWLHKAT